MATTNAVLREVSALDFDDLLTESVRLLRESPESLEHWSNRFQHVLIDEFQDVNEAQFQWARMLASQTWQHLRGGRR